MKKRVCAGMLAMYMVMSSVACVDFEGELQTKEKDEMKDEYGYVEGVTKIYIGDINDDDIEDAVVVDDSVISLISKGKVIQTFEPDSSFKYKKVDAIVNDIDNDKSKEVIVMASIGGNDPIYSIYVLDTNNKGEFEIRNFPNEINNYATNSGVNAQVVPKDFLLYEIVNENFLFNIDVSRSYGVSTLDENRYVQLCEKWEEILKENIEGQIMGIVRGEIITNTTGQKVFRVYEMIQGADKAYIGLLVVDVAFDQTGGYEIVNYGLFEHSVLMP